MPSTTARAAKMPKKELEKYRRLLGDKKSSLVSDLAKTKNAEEETTEESTRTSPTRPSHPTRGNSSILLNDAERNTIQQTDQALSRIEDGSYGFARTAATR